MRSIDVFFLGIDVLVVIIEVIIFLLFFMTVLVFRLDGFRYLVFWLEILEGATHPQSQLFGATDHEVISNIEGECTVWSPCVFQGDIRLNSKCFELHWPHTNNVWIEQSCLDFNQAKFTVFVCKSVENLVSIRTASRWLDLYVQNFLLRHQNNISILVLQSEWAYHLFTLELTLLLIFI